MHVPDWDSRFLAHFDPAAWAAACAAAGADAVMVYCNSHTGDCFWPTRVGKMHRGIESADLVGDFVALFHERDIAVCAYYSAIFNNRAYREHPDWRIVASGSGGAFGEGTRYGVCCPNNPDYMAFMLGQTEELAGGYRFDAFFFDMVFWPDVCVCASCRDRFLREEGEAIPTVVDWCSEIWCRFQAARERWLAEAFERLRRCVVASLDVPVFCNSDGWYGGDWVFGGSGRMASGNDLVGGDFSDPTFLSAFAQMTPSAMQYMYPISLYTGSASSLRPVEEQTLHALRATAFGGQFMAIDAVEPDGAFVRDAYGLLSDVFDAIEPYASYVGSKPIADVGVYLSVSSLMSFAENGTSLSEVALRLGAHRPHLEAVRGAFTSLLEAHLPVGVITRLDLGRLGDHAVVVLPNVLRMDAEEIEAFRSFVADGGRLYASGYTSLVESNGTRHPDFALADLFGCRFVGEEQGAVTYVEPATPALAQAIHPLRYVDRGEPLLLFDRGGPSPTVLRIEQAQGAEVLATITRPYGDGRGSRDDRGWASIHSSPPWERTDRPAITRNRVEGGEVVYSCADIESASAGAAALFVALICQLLPQAPRFAAVTHPDMWVTAFDDEPEHTMRVCFLNDAKRLPALPVPRVAFTLRAPAGRRFTALRTVGEDTAVPFATDADGTLRAELHDVEQFEMLLARYEEFRNESEISGSAHRLPADAPAG